MGMAKNTRKRGREQAGTSREGRRTMEKVLENTVRDMRIEYLMPYFVKLKDLTCNFCSFYHFFYFSASFYLNWMKIISKFR